MHKLAIASLPLLVTAGAFAQGGVVPPWMANSPGSGTTNYPFGLGTACRVQYEYDAATTGMVAPNLFTMFQVRSAHGVANTAKANIVLQIEMSATPITRATLSTTFANNRGANHTVVYAQRPTSMPSTAPSILGTLATPFVLDAPFLYDPTAGNSLLVEFGVASQPSGTWTIDTAWSAAGVHFQVGSGCSSMTATSSGGLIGGALTFTTGGAPANAAGAALLGFTEFPVPIPVPGNPICSLFHTIDASAAVVTSATGAASLPLTVPSNNALKGASIYGQFAAIDPSFLIFTSPARRVFLTASDECGRVYNLTSNTSLTGTVQGYVAPVLAIQ